MRCLQQPVVSGGNLLVNGGIIEQVAGNLLACKPVKGQVQVERINNLVTVRSDIMILVSMVADRVGKAHKVKPIHRHSFSKIW